MTQEAAGLASLHAIHRLPEACGISGGKFTPQMLRAVLLSGARRATQMCAPAGTLNP